jgi:phosphoglycerol transferase MdoB-like AlkP superfamily enzyme
MSFAAALIGGLLVLLQGLTVGLFGGYHAGFHWGSFLLHVLVLAPLPVAFFFSLAEVTLVPERFLVDVAAAMVATGLILIVLQAIGGLRSSDLTLVKFAATAYGTYFVVYRLAMSHSVQEIRERRRRERLEKQASAVGP